MAKPGQTEFSGKLLNLYLSTCFRKEMFFFKEKQLFDESEKMTLIQVNKKSIWIMLQIETLNSRNPYTTSTSAKEVALPSAVFSQTRHWKVPWYKCLIALPEEYSRKSLNTKP